MAHHPQSSRSALLGVAVVSLSFGCHAANVPPANAPVATQSSTALRERNLDSARHEVTAAHAV